MAKASLQVSGLEAELILLGPCRALKNSLKANAPQGVAQQFFEESKKPVSKVGRQSWILSFINDVPRSNVSQTEMDWVPGIWHIVLIVDDNSI